MKAFYGISRCAFAAAMAWAAQAAAQEATPPASPTGAEQTAPDALQDTTSAAPAQADAGIGDIIVTAQRRSESLQKTALAISVVQPQALATAGITSAVQLTSIAPTLQVGNSGAATSVYVRGVGSYASTAGQSPAVPYYIDGVYVARTQSVASEFYDVDRLEVLKGPQGTLYGRNASGGAINVISKRPVLGKFEGNASLELGNFGNQNGEVAINIPVGDTLALRASAQIVDKGGYTSIGLGDDVHQAGRVKLLWQPRSDISLLLNASYGHIGGLGGAWVILNKDVPGWYPWLDASDPRSQAYLQTHSVFAPIGTPAPPGFVRPTSKSDAFQDLSFYNVSAEFNWNLSETTTLTVIPSYRNSKMQYAPLFSFLYRSGLGLGDQPARPETSDATSVEARLSGDTDALKWVAGLYFFNEDQFQQYTINAGLAQSIGLDSSFGTRSYAAFGQATYSITDRFRVTGGLRYTSDRRSIFDGVSYVVSPSLFLGPPPPGGAPCSFPAPTQATCAVDSYAGTKTYKNVSWKGGVELDVLTDGLLFATASRGFKAGGYNTQSAAGTPGAALAFKPETLTSYDVGFKNRFLDNKLQVNVGAFYWDYKDHQEPKISLTNAGLINLIYYNAGSSRIYGGNVEIVARPWSGGTLSGSVEYAHSEYLNFQYDVPTATFNPRTTGCPGKPSTAPGQTTVDCSGNETAKTPKFAGGASFTQEVALRDGKVLANANLTFASARWLAIDFTPIERAKAYATLDLSLTYQSPGNRWSVTGFVRNVTDGRVYTQANQNPFSDTTVGNIAQQRSFGGRLAVRF